MYKKGQVLQKIGTRHHHHFGARLFVQIPFLSDYFMEYFHLKQVNWFRFQFVLLAFQLALFSPGQDLLQNRPN